MTDYPERFRDLGTIYLGESGERATKLRAYQLEAARPDKKSHWLPRLQGIDDRNAAELLRERYVYVSLADAVPLADDEVYLFQVIGLQAETPSGEDLGRVVDVMETGANDVFVLRGDRYGEVLIPAINGVVLSIDVAAGKVIIDPLPGLLPDSVDDDVVDSDDDRDDSGPAIADVSDSDLSLDATEA
jgi:16S rRNA processing protein RimM